MIFGLVLLAACSSSSSSNEPGLAPPDPAAEPPPPAQCKTPGPLPAGAWFTDITAQSGLADVEGIRIVAADLDGDGLPDLLIHGGRRRLLQGQRVLPLLVRQESDPVHA